MTIDLKPLYDEALAAGQSPKEALRASLEEALRDLSETHRGTSAATLAEEAAVALAEALARIGADDEESLSLAFEMLINTIQRPKEEAIERLIVEIDRLRRHLRAEEAELQRNLHDLFIGIERAAESLPPQRKRHWKEALENTQLEHVEGLGILNETVEAALIAALEEGDATRDTVRDVVRQITHKALGEGTLGAARIRAILSTILTRASDLAEASPTRADAIIHGTVYGINDALIVTVRQLKEQLQFAPDEIRGNRVANWEELTRMLSRSDELYREIIDIIAANSSPFVAEKLRDSADILGDQFAELKRISLETIDIARTKLTALAKEAAIKGAELKNQLASEARKLGTKAWKKAVEVAEAYKSRLDK